MSGAAFDLRELIVEVVREELAKLAPKPPERLSTVEAATEAGVHPKTIRRWIRQGKLLHEMAGREIRVRRVDLEAALRPAAPRTNLTPEQTADRDFERYFRR